MFLFVEIFGEGDLSQLTSVRIGKDNSFGVNDKNASPCKDAFDARKSTFDHNENNDTRSFPLNKNAQKQISEIKDSDKIEILLKEVSSSQIKIHATRQSLGNEGQLDIFKPSPGEDPDDKFNKDMLPQYKKNLDAFLNSMTIGIVVTITTFYALYAEDFKVLVFSAHANQPFDIITIIAIIIFITEIV